MPPLLCVFYCCRKLSSTLFNFCFGHSGSNFRPVSLGIMSMSNPSPICTEVKSISISLCDAEHESLSLWPERPYGRLFMHSLPDGRKVETRRKRALLPLVASLDHFLWGVGCHPLRHLFLLRLLFLGRRSLNASEFVSMCILFSPFCFLLWHSLSLVSPVFVREVLEPFSRPQSHDVNKLFRRFLPSSKMVISFKKWCMAEQRKPSLRQSRQKRKHWLTDVWWW